MRIDLVAVGKRMPSWVDAGFIEYSKRLPKKFNFNLIEINPAVRSKNHSIENYKEKEYAHILSNLAKESVLIVLDEKGKKMSSTVLASKLQTWHDDNRHISLVIGGADGLSETLKKKADEQWSLSVMTLPHGLVRVVVTEQIYRAWSIIQNHPYHRE